MRFKLKNLFLIILVSLLALSGVSSINAQENNITAGNQMVMVVQVTKTPTNDPQPTPEPVIISTPMPDGTVKHIIGAGQSLWTIAEAYDVPYTDLIELNELEPDAIVLIGDEVIIAPSYTPTSTPIGEPSPTPPPRYSHTPSLGTPQATDKSFSPATSVPTETLKVEPRFRTSGKNPLIVIMAIIVSGGSLAAALYFSLRERE